MIENIRRAEVLAKYFNKKYGVILYSGTLAIESALLCSNIKKGDKVLISSTVCYAIVEAIIKVGAIPVIVIPENGFVLSENEIKVTLQNFNINCIIAVHQFGIVQNVGLIREICGMGVTIIEDVAQAWGIVDNNNSAGKYSDYVVTSFGLTKPLSLGIGGAIFSNKLLSSYFDFSDNISRNSEKLLLPYVYSLCEKINVDKLIVEADNSIKKQREIAKMLINGLDDNKGIKIIGENIFSKSTWHRFPIIINSKVYYNKIIKLLDFFEVQYQLPHDKQLFEIDMVKNSNAIIIGNKINSNNIILIRTRNNKKKNIGLFLKEIKEVKNYE